VQLEFNTNTTINEQPIKTKEKPTTAVPRLAVYPRPPGGSSATRNTSITTCAAWR